MAWGFPGPDPPTPGRAPTPGIHSGDTKLSDTFLTALYLRGGETKIRIAAKRVGFKAKKKGIFCDDLSFPRIGFGTADRSRGAEARWCLCATARL